MLSRLTLPKVRATEPALDQPYLYALGLEHVRGLARRIWTDHNIHDPGITTLELLCYALTDLAYRASYPIQDLLATAESAAAEGPSALFTARQILPNRPLTLIDYRKLLIDLKDVKNAWIKPVELTYFADTIKAGLLHEAPQRPGVREVKLRGLYEVLVEPMDDVTSEAATNRVLAAVKKKLAANRNLCEDFVDATAIERQSFMLCAELELAPEADVSRVQAEVLFQVDRFLAPPVVNYSLSEMLERRKPDGSRYTVEEIFDGPALECGFIDDAELARAELRTEIHLSDLISLVMRIDGVRAVTDMVINPVGAQTLKDKWRVPVAPRSQPTLAMDRCRLVFYKRNMPVVSAVQSVETHLAALVAGERAKLETPHPYDLPVPRGLHRRPERYHSFQNHFPALYGLSEYGPPPGAGPKRQAQVYQLKAYLLFFDQIMADYCAQLARVKDLFAIDPALHKTYFHQVVASFAEFDKIYGVSDVATALETQVDDPAAGIERRSRFLDHLVARFAERFHDYAAIMRSVFGASPQSLISVKCAFLESCPAVGAERGIAYDAALKEDGDLWNTHNVSGLEKRLARLLGMSDTRRRNLSEISYDVYAEIDATPGDEFRFRVRHRTTGKILLSGSTKYTTRELARKWMLHALSFAQKPAGYERAQTSDGRFYFNVVDDTGEVLARRIEYFATEAQRDAAIDGLIDYLKEHYSDEGMYLIENILLRPEGSKEPFLPICVDPNCTDCEDDDPYSYRIHVVLPAWAGRFENMEFRRFAEEIIRQETPAHVLPKVCWISKEDMAMLEGAYRAWLEARAGNSSKARKEKLETLIRALYSVKNVYPSQSLHQCDAGEELPKFLLGKTALGSAGPSGNETE